MNQEPTPNPYADSIRAAGGIVHSDGNIFFTNHYQFAHAASLICGTATVALATSRAPAATNERCVMEQAAECIELLLDESVGEGFRVRDRIDAEMVHGAIETAKRLRAALATSRAPAADERSVMERIVALFEWDEVGATKPIDPWSWETVARMASDFARAALAGEAATQPAAEPEWINWTEGDGSPLFSDGDMVATRTRDGRELSAQFRPWEFSGWKHNGGRNDIVAYKIERATQPAEVMLNGLTAEETAATASVFGLASMAAPSGTPAGAPATDWTKVPPDQWPTKCPKCGEGLSYTSYEPYCSYADCRWNNDDAAPAGAPAVDRAMRAINEAAHKISQGRETPLRGNMTAEWPAAIGTPAGAPAALGDGAERRVEAYIERKRRQAGAPAVTERATFEAWARRQPWIKDVQRYPDTHDRWPGEYGHYDTKKAWEVWQQARASLGATPAQSDTAKNAARYEWLRRCRGQEHDPLFTVQHELDGTLWGGDLDAAIDAAMKEPQS